MKHCKLLLVASLTMLLILIGHTPIVMADASATLSVQVMDSCKQALPGATLALVDVTHTVLATATTPGTKRHTVESGSCPLPRGTCALSLVGCVAFSIPIPSSGNATYTIIEAPTYSASDGFWENPIGPTADTGFVPCDGGSACHDQLGVFTIDSTGAIFGQTLNVYPDNQTVTWPSVTTFFTGSISDPLVLHNFQLGTGICSTSASLDSNFLTGSPSSHCANATPGVTWNP